MPENKFTPIEHIFTPEDLSSRVLDPASLPQPSYEKAAFVAPLKLGLNNVVFGSGGYRELEPFERHVFNCLLLQRETGISWASLVETRLHQRSDHPLNRHSFTASLESLDGKLRAVIGFPVIQQIAESGWYNLHPACKFIDARPRPAFQEEAAEDEEEGWPQKERAAAIRALTHVYGDAPQCSELLRKFQKPGHKSEIRTPDRDEMDALFRTLNEGIAIILEQAHEGWKPNSKQEESLAKAAAAYSVLVRGNQGFLWYLTRNKFQWIDPEHRIQIGNIALNRAIEAFDPDKGFTFSTFAGRCIKNLLVQEGRKERFIIPPSYMEEMVGEVVRQREAFQAQYRREPSPAELSQATGFPEKKIKEILSCLASPLSLDAPLEEERTLADIIAPTIEDNSAAEERVEVIFNLPALTVQEKLALSLRFGVYNEQLAEERIYSSGGIQRYKDCFPYLHAGSELNITEISLLLNTPSYKVTQWLRQAIERIRQANV